MTVCEKYQQFETTARASYAAAAGSLARAQQRGGVLAIRGPGCGTVELDEKDLVTAHLFVELQRFLGLLLNFETLYYSLIVIAARELRGETVCRRSIRLWSGDYKFPDAVRKLIGIDAQTAQIEVPGIQSPAPLDHFREYWKVRNQWMHHAGILDCQLRHEVPGLVQLGWFDHVPDERAWVIGVNSAPHLGVYGAEHLCRECEGWKGLPLEQVLRHVKGMAEWLCDQSVYKHSQLKGHIK